MLLIQITIIVIAGLLAAGTYLLWEILRAINNGTASQRAIMAKLDAMEKPAKPGSVTDPFVAANKRNDPGASSRHVIIRKSPDQIRAENYEKIKKEGQEYGGH